MLEIEMLLKHQHLKCVPSEINTLQQQIEFDETDSANDQFKVTLL